MSSRISEKAKTKQEIYRDHGLGKGKLSFEFFTKILKHLGAYFKLSQPNRASLGIIGKVSSSSTT